MPRFAKITLVPYLAVALTLTAQTVQAQEFSKVNILIPMFQNPQGESNVGSKSAIILGLQIWRTYSTDTRSGSSFDNANITYNPTSVPKTQSDAERLGRRARNKPHLILWGRASRYGVGVVVESNLLIPSRLDKETLGTNVWSVKIPSGTTVHTISVDVPSRQYEFAPIVLDSKILKIADERSSFINVYELKSMITETIGRLDRASIRALKHEGDWSRVEVQDSHRVGWVYLPQLSTSPSEVVNFCGGIIRFLRKDWAGSIKLFQEIIETSNAPTSIKVDSYLYMSMAFDKVHDSTRSFSMVAEAYKLNPYSKTTSQYLLMAYLSQLQRVLQTDRDGEEAKTLIRSLQDLLSKNRVLFADNDEWLAQAEGVVKELALDDKQ
jgi:hypothetical protein